MPGAKNYPEVRVRRGDDVTHVLDRLREGQVPERPHWTPIAAAPPVVGIDPGHHGALCLLRDGALPEIVLMPTRTGELGRPVPDEIEIVQLLKGWASQVSDLHVVMERMQSRTDDTPMTALSLGRSQGTLITTVILAGLPLTIIAPGTWQEAMLDGAEAVRSDDFERGKERAGARALELWPTYPWPRRPRTKRYHDGCIDASLLAEYGRRQLAPRRAYLAHQQAFMLAGGCRPEQEME